MMKLTLHKPLESILTVLFLLFFFGCMTVTDKHTIVESSNDRKTFGGKKIAVLPVNTQKSLATDSVMPQRREINKRLGSTLQKRLAKSNVKDLADVINKLNTKNAIPIFEQLLTTYDNTGVIDIKKTNALGKALGSDYLLLSNLKAEKMDLVLMNANGASLELMLVTVQKGKIEWGGTGNWKRGGIFGAGKASPEEVAESMVNLAYESL